MAAFEPTGEQVFYAIVFGPIILVGLCVAWVVCVICGGITMASLSRYPQLVSASPRMRALWRIAAWMPVVGPAAYGVALLARRAMLGGDGWRAARARPVGQEVFVPKLVQWQTVTSAPNPGGVHPHAGVSRAQGGPTQ